MQGDGANTPQTLKASIERGALHAFGRQLPLPIRRAQCQTALPTLRNPVVVPALSDNICLLWSLKGSPNQVLTEHVLMMKS